jgi:hypothetical protein
MTFEWTHGLLSRHQMHGCAVLQQYGEADSIHHDFNRLAGIFAGVLQPVTTLAAV